MKKKIAYALWGGLYCLCVGLGFAPNVQGVGKFLLVASAVIFFLPAFYLAFGAIKENNRKTLLVLRLISGGILALSLVLLVLNFLAVYFSTQTGLVLYVLLVMFTAPMVCGQYWFLSLFLWACLFMLTLQRKTPCQK